MRFTGSCHCGNISIEFESALDPAEITVRACQCSFCRKHGTCAVADPNGMLTIKVADRAQLNCYTFGLKTAEYLICRACGVYVAALTLEEGNRRAIAIVNALDNCKLFSQPPLPMSYDAEDRAQRLKRRAALWMPVSIERGA